MKILIVEDDAEFLELAAHFLNKHEISKATNLLEGINEVKKGKFDLLISDWHLDDFGYEIAEEIIELALERGIRTIIETSNPDNEALDIFRNKADIVDKLDFWDKIERLVEGSKRRSKES